ncbi:MetQ/NlpA family ABC transporter substrate-binding protein [Halotalea alkalilenta]|uniref:MetQ/NlpA family ABC transporter substrate-binding protein n=1 Tax=Halotalea alkalilenta TaxID=376489 RepID=UPI0009DF288B|nr:MetQ/NlpA family ABC transporter substrate-binding protein [Halotalea alkalilenta]
MYRPSAASRLTFTHSDDPRPFADLSRRVLVACGCVMLLGMSMAAARADVTVGINGGPQAEAVYKAAELAGQQGVPVRVLEFSDWTTPNTALVNGDIDVNYFQHRPFLANAERQGGFDLVPLAFGVENNIGLYSTRLTDPQQVEEGATVAVADDPVNQGRGLALFQQVGLIELEPGVGVDASVHDIVSNPKNLRFIELPGPQLARAIDDVAIAQGYPQHLLAAGTKDPTDALVLTHDQHHTFALIFAVRPQDVDREDIKTFIHVYQTAPEVRELLAEAYGDPSLYELAWLDDQGQPTVTPASLDASDVAATQ